MRDIATILSRIEIFRIGNDEIMGKISKKAEKNPFSVTITNLFFPSMSIVIVIAETSLIEPGIILTNIGMLLSDENSIIILICG